MYPVTRRSIFDILLVIVAIIVVATLLTSNLSVAPARAAGPIGVYFNPPGSATTCDSTIINLNVNIFNNIPADGKTYTYILGPYARSKMVDRVSLGWVGLSRETDPDSTERQHDDRKL